MDPVASFRPSREEREAIERVRRAHGFGTPAEAVQYLVREGARQAAAWSDGPLFRFRIEGFVEPGEELGPGDVDRVLHGGA
jgi:hypothetical protein